MAVGAITGSIVSPLGGWTRPEGKGAAGSVVLDEGNGEGGGPVSAIGSVSLVRGVSWLERHKIDSIEASIESYGVKYGETGWGTRVENDSGLTSGSKNCSSKNWPNRFSSTAEMILVPRAEIFTDSDIMYRARDLYNVNYFSWGKRWKYMSFVFSRRELVRISFKEFDRMLHWPTNDTKPISYFGNFLEWISECYEWNVQRKYLQERYLRSTQRAPSRSQRHSSKIRCRESEEKLREWKKRGKRKARTLNFSQDSISGCFFASSSAARTYWENFIFCTPCAHSAQTNTPSEGKKNRLRTYIVEKNLVSSLR